MLDPLTDILQLCRIDAAVFSRAVGGPPFGVSTRGGAAGIFHVVVRGRVRAEVGEEVHDLGPGAVLILPRGAPHVLRDAPETPATWIGDLPSTRGASGLPVVAMGPGDATEILCGTLHLRDEGQLVPHLPEVLRTDGAQSGWVGLAATQLQEEAERASPGARVAVARLAELLFIAALRDWIAGAPAEGAPNVLAALRDPALSRAIGLMHAEPGQPWSVDHLARRVGLSRSAFFDRFSRLVGVPPASYLATWRMALARRALVETDVGLGALAGQMGYGSESAFLRAFKREVGATPAAWRRARGLAAVG